MSSFAFSMVALFAELMGVMGTAILAIAWAKVLKAHSSDVGSSKSAALYVFSISVCIEAIGSAIIPWVPRDRIQSIWTAVFAVAFLVLITSMVLASRRSGPEERTMMIGSTVMCAFYGMAFAGLLALVV